jgi:hypothetical protein
MQKWQNGLIGLVMASALAIGLVCITQSFGRVSVARLSRLLVPESKLRYRLGGSSNTLTVDPVLAYSTFLGGPSQGIGSEVVQGANVMFVDGSGNVYVAGVTNSANFPVTSGVVQVDNSEYRQRGFLAKINPSGQSLIFSTYIVGLYSVSALAVDTTGNVYVAGPAGSDLPIPPGTMPFQAAPKPVGILKLNSTATEILAGTYLGGSGRDGVNGIALDSEGNLYVGGSTTSNDFPVSQNALQTSLGNSAFNLFLTKLNPSLSGLAYSTYLGQDSAVSQIGGPPHGLAVDAVGDAYIVGSSSSGFPTTSNAFQGTCGTDQCALLAKLNSDGSALLYSTYLSSHSNTSRGVAVAVDSAQNVYIGGQTGSGFPEMNALQSCSASNGFSSGGFVSEIDASGSLKFSTCLSGSIADLVLDSFGNIYVVGSSYTSLPLKNPIQTNALSNQGFGSAFVVAINPNNTPSLLFSSFIVGAQPNEVELPASLGVDSSGNIYATGTAATLGGGGPFGPDPSPFPVFNALQPVPAVGPGCGHFDCNSTNAFIMKILPADGAAAALTPALVAFSPQLVGSQSAPQQLTIIDMGSAALTISNAVATGDFALQNNCGTVSPAGGSCTIEVTFTPTATGTRTGTLTITDNSAGSPRTVEMTGLGATVTLTPTPGSLTFASQIVGTTSAPQTVTVNNPGPLAAEITRLESSGDFAETNNCGASVPANSSCTVNVTFTPSTSGSRTGTLTITDNATDSPQVISLTGTGSTGFAMSASNPSATASAGTTATFNLTATAAAGFSGTVNFACTGAPPLSTCSVSPNSVSLAGGTPASFTVAVATTGSTTAQLLPRGENLDASARLGRLAPLFGSFVLGAMLLTAKGNSRRTLVLLGIGVLLGVEIGCGGGGGSSTKVTGTPSGTYALSVTGTSGTSTQTTTLSLTVQ